MYILKINNINKHGIMDYKGLDIDLFVAGSQFYYGGENNIENCLVKTEEILTDFSHNDVVEIEEKEYWQIIEEYKSEPTQPEPTEEQKKIVHLEKSKEITMKALIELHAKILTLEGEK